MRQEAGEIQPVNVCYLLHDRDTKFTCSFRAIIEFRSRQDARAACPQSELEWLCGALGEIGEGAIPVQGGSF